MILVNLTPRVVIVLGFHLGTRGTEEHECLSFREPVLIVGEVCMGNGNIGKRKNISERVNVQIIDEEVFIFEVCPDDESEVRWVQRVVQEGMNSILGLEMCFTGRARLSVKVLHDETPFLNELIL
jgi:hypothetical protein